MKKIIILTYDGFFTQSSGGFNTVNLKDIETRLEKNGLIVERLEYSILASNNYVIESDAIYWCGSHQNPDVKMYINDVLTFRFYDKNNLIPRLKSILAHENKGVMGMLSSELNITLNSQKYVCQDNRNLTKSISYPVVVKTIAGAGGQGVKLAKSKEEIIKFLNKNILSGYTFQNIINFFKNRLRYFLGNESPEKYTRKKLRFVYQDFTEDLDCDYKVLVFFDRLYVLKRKVREKDFRASGSGNFIFENSINEKILDRAFETSDKLDEPFVSLDIILDKFGKTSVIEFQCCHFGPYTQIHSEFYFDREGRRIDKEDTSFECELSSALIRYLNKKNLK